MNKLTNTLLLFFFVMTVSVHQTAAHALWIHTDSQGQKGQSHAFTIYYADYHEGAVETIADWYSDVREFDLYLVSPSGTKTQLDYEAEKDFVKGSFVPEEEGIYRLEIGHSSKTEAGETLYQFNALAYVSIGSKTKQANFKNSPDLVLLPGKSKGVYQVQLEGKPLPESEVSILGPDSVSQTLSSDAKGEFAADFSSKGTYYVEASTYKEYPQGHSSGLSGIWRCVTQVIQID